MNQHSPAFLIGAIFGGVFVGILSGLIPLAFGRKRERPGLGWVGFVLCMVSGGILGLLGALPMAGIWSLVIAVAGSPAREIRRATANLGPRSPTSEPYDL